MPKLRFVQVFVFGIFLTVVLFAPDIYAVVSSCGASVNRNSVVRNTTNNFIFTINNTDSVTYNWIKITRPSATYWTINSGSATGWSASSNSNDITLTGGGLSASGSLEVTLNATAADSTSGSLNWIVQVSDNGGGSNFSCTGSLGTSILEDTNNPDITNITITDVASSSVKVTWTTDENANSVVEYGLTESLGTTASDSTLTTSHSVSLSSLTANTKYYSVVRSTDNYGNEGESGIFTFSTAASGTTGQTQTVTVTKTETKTVADTTLPSVSISTDLTKVYQEAPKISGKATDDVGVSAVEYSIDGGRNWLPAEGFTIGAKSTVFTFSPIIIDDGNYDIKVRAIDPSGNKTVSKTYTLVIDRLPPLVGGALFSIGPMVLLPDINGNIFAIEGLNTKVTLSAVGGPISLDILTNSESLKANDELQNQTFSLVKNIESGLWAGEVNIAKDGVYDLITRSIDGAENVTEGELGTIIFLNAGRVIEGEKFIKGGEVKVFAFEPGLGEFLLWEAEPYGQENPQKVNTEGAYRLILPAGRYYLEVSAPGYKRVRTNIFEISRPTPVIHDFSLEKRFGLKLGDLFIGLPDFKSRVVDIKFGGLKSSKKTASSEGKDLPDFSLQTGEDSISNISLLGKSSVLTFISTWSPEASDQLAALEEFFKEYKEINSYAISEQESISKVETFKKIGGYEIPIVADPDGILIDQFDIRYFPSHVFTDRKGIIKKVVVGFLTKEELIDNLLD